MPVDAAHPPLLNPAPGVLPARGVSQSAFSCDHESEASDDGGSSSSGNDSESIRGCVMCRKGTFRGTAFFIAEGQGQVVLDAQDETGEIQRHPSGDGGGSSTESLLAAKAFGNRCIKKAKRRRRRGEDDKNDGNNGKRRPGGHNTSARHAEVGATTADELGPAAGTATGSTSHSEQRETEFAKDDQKEQTTAGDDPIGALAGDSYEEMNGQRSQVPSPSAVLSVSLSDGEQEAWGSRGGAARSPRLAELRRGDFFGVDPALPTGTASSPRVSIATNDTPMFTR